MPRGVRPRRSVGHIHRVRTSPDEHGNNLGARHALADGQMQRGTPPVVHPDSEGEGNRLEALLCADEPKSFTTHGQGRGRVAGRWWACWGGNRSTTASLLPTPSSPLTLLFEAVANQTTASLVPSARSVLEEAAPIYMYAACAF